MIGIIYQVGPQHLVSSLIILFCGGQIAAASVGIAVENRSGASASFQISMAIRHMASLGTPQRQPWLTKDTESLCQHTAFVCLHPEGASPPSATSSRQFRLPSPPPLQFSLLFPCPAHQPQTGRRKIGFPRVPGASAPMRHTQRPRTGTHPPPSVPGPGGSGAHILPVFL